MSILLRFFKSSYEPQYVNKLGSIYFDNDDVSIATQLNIYWRDHEGYDIEKVLEHVPIDSRFVIQAKELDSRVKHNITCKTTGAGSLTGHHFVFPISYISGDIPFDTIIVDTYLQLSGESGIFITGQNIGNKTGEVFAQKDGNFLKFKTLDSSDGTLDITNAGDHIDLKVPVSGVSIGFQYKYQSDNLTDPASGYFTYKTGPATLKISKTDNQGVNRSFPLSNLSEYSSLIFQSGDITSNKYFNLGISKGVPVDSGTFYTFTNTQTVGFGFTNIVDQDTLYLTLNDQTLNQLNELLDCNINGPSQSQIIQYNGGNDKWENTDLILNQGGLMMEFNESVNPPNAGQINYDITTETLRVSKTGSDGSDLTNYTSPINLLDTNMELSSWAGNPLLSGPNASENGVQILFRKNTAVNDQTTYWEYSPVIAFYGSSGLVHLFKIISPSVTILEDLLNVDGTNNAEGNILVLDANNNWVSQPLPAYPDIQGANVGLGTGQVFRNKTGDTLNFKSIVVTGGSIGITNNADDITLSYTEAPNDWNTLLNKPSTFPPDPHTIMSHSDTLAGDFPPDSSGGSGTSTNWVWDGYNAVGSSAINVNLGVGIMFDLTTNPFSNRWLNTPPLYNTGTGIYGGPFTLNSTSGEWFYLDLPSAKAISAFTMMCTQSNRVPRRFIMYGSNDNGASYTTVFNQLLVDAPDISGYPAPTYSHTFTLPSPSAGYTRFAFVINAVHAPTDGYFDISRFSFTGAVINDNYLVFQNGIWEPTENNLNSHKDVTITNPVNDQLLKYSGGQWVNSTLTTGAIVGTTDTQTLSNKSLIDASTSIIDDLDPTKQLKFQSSTITTATTRTYEAQDSDGRIMLSTTGESVKFDNNSGGDQVFALNGGLGNTTGDRINCVRNSNYPFFSGVTWSNLSLVTGAISFENYVSPLVITDTPTPLSNYVLIPFVGVLQAGSFQVTTNGAGRLTNNDGITWTFLINWSCALTGANGTEWEVALYINGSKVSNSYITTVASAGRYASLTGVWYQPLNGSSVGGTAVPNQYAEIYIKRNQGSGNVTIGSAFLSILAVRMLPQPSV